MKSYNSLSMWQEDPPVLKIMAQPLSECLDILGELNNLLLAWRAKSAWSRADSHDPAFGHASACSVVGSLLQPLAREDIGQTLALLLDVKQIAVTWGIAQSSFRPCLSPYASAIVYPAAAPAPLPPADKSPQVFSSLDSAAASR